MVSVWVPDLKTMVSSSAQGSVHVDRYVVEVPEGRHRTHLAVGEGISEAFLVRELYLAYTESTPMP